MYRDIWRDSLGCTKCINMYRWQVAFCMCCQVLQTSKKAMAWRYVCALLAEKSQNMCSWWSSWSSCAVCATCFLLEVTQGFFVLDLLTTCLWPSCPPQLFFLLVCTTFVRVRVMILNQKVTCRILLHVFYLNSILEQDDFTMLVAVSVVICLSISCEFQHLIYKVSMSWPQWHFRVDCPR